MNTFANIITRRSTRKYLDKEVSQELLGKIIETGKYAPSGGNSQSNHF
ncbi:nitroreductase family protein [Faecalibacillus intestinalis]|jgi:nitroreductase|nr:nitroreductase family protein [Faecalibacillus intestinalis]MCG4811313.1 nitroreductase family protein [Faecalibacillus intestinalis]